MFPSKRAIIVLTLVAAIIVAGVLFFLVFLQSPEIEFSLKAAVIDQLVGEQFQNPAFNNTVTNLLIDAGFSVFYYESQSVTVNFYKELAKSNYGIIILRAHSALRVNEAVVDIFTSEIFSDDAHVNEQDVGWLTRGHYLGDSTYYFAIAPTFIENLEGNFPKSIVIAMGCNSLNSSCTEMADAFYRKGAKAYIGWTGLVNSPHTDSETAKLLELLLSEKRTIEDAVDRTLPDLDNLGSEMDFYPRSAGDLNVSALINSAKTSQTSHIASYKPEQNLHYLIMSSVSPRARKIQF